ncbi:MAG: hypothetical protein KAJ35_04250 [Thermoplasmata archaeon]|nr:hypothetical protein [Thermoplasmata archaeon]
MHAPILRPTLYILAILLILTWMTPATPAAAEAIEGHLPVWEEGFGWSYLVDHDVDFDIADFIHINHIKENWTRTVDKVLDVNEQSIYKVWEQRTGTLRGTITYGLTFPVTADAYGSGWTYIRASDMAIINQSFNLTFTGDLPLGQGKFTGGFNNFTTYDPPMPMLEFPIPSTKWDVASTVNITSEFFILLPFQDSTWYNTSELWDLDVTATVPTSMTVPAGTYDTFTIHETGTRSNATDSWPVDRKWYYADSALNFIKTFEGHELVWTDAVYTPPNLPPVGPTGTVTLTAYEDVPLDIDLTQYFSDPDEDALTFSLSLVDASGGNASLNGTGASWTLSPSANWSGVLDLQAIATDPLSQRATGELVVTVTAVNDPPRVVWEPHDLVTEEDNPIVGAHDVAEVFDDVDGDPLTLSANSTEGVTVFMNGTWVDIVPDADWTGRATITLVAVDHSGEEAITSFELMVGEVNDPPVITGSSGPARIHEAEEGVFWVEADDMDSDDLEFTWSVNGLVAGGVVGPTFTYAPGDLTVSSVTITVTVEDNWKAQATASWDVTIMDSPWIVSSRPTSSVSAMVGDTVTFSIFFQDADTPDPNIRWTWNGDLVGTGEVLPMMFGDRDEGDGTLLVVVDDGIGNDSVEWSVTVTIPNRPPTVSIDSPGDGAEIPREKIMVFRAEVDDEDVANLTVRWSVDGSPVGTGIEYDYSVTRTGRLVIGVSVSDGEYTVSDTSTIEIWEPTESPGHRDDAFPWGTVLIALLLAGVIILTVAFFLLRTRPGRQG